MATVVEGVTIKKEIEDPDSPDGQDSSVQAENQNGQKSAKVWGDSEIRSLIELAKVYIPKFKDPGYNKKQLQDDISAEMCLMGFDVTPDNVRSKLKYLRTRYRSILHYNMKHVTKRTMPFENALHELYSLDYFNDQDILEQNGNGISDLATKRTPKSKPVPASHVDLRTVVTSKKRKVTHQVVHKGTKFVLKRKVGGKSRGQPMFQCGSCMQKFSTSQDMHDHGCSFIKGCADDRQSAPASLPASAGGSFHWNSLITMHLLDLLKDYQNSHKNSNFRKGNIWDNMSSLMRHKGHTVPPKEVEKKWKVLSTAFEKTLKYNKTHKDKKKCAFFKRLTELHQHPSSFTCFRADWPTRMTVEVSPFSVAASRDFGTPKQDRADDTKGNTAQGGSMPELMLWLENTWTEYKEMEERREAAQTRRHQELLEMLSYLVESKMDT